MTIKQQWIVFYTILRRELVRMFRIASQVFLPPVMTTALYFLIFGTVIGHRIGTIEGFDYSLFIAPGLIMMAVIVNSYGNVSTSLFSVRFQRSVEEMLVSPMSNQLLLMGYVAGGILRGIIVAFLVYLTACLFIGFHFHHLLMSLFVISSVAAVFSLAGFTNAMLARTFDDVMLIPTFVLTPLTYLGGVFYSTTMLPPVWQAISHFNPIFHMVHALRYAMLNGDPGDMGLSLGIILVMLIGLIIINLILLKKGTGLRE